MSESKPERFTQRAWHVMILAEEESVRLKHNMVGAEHLLLAMVREGGGVAAHVLQKLGVEGQKVEELLMKLTRATPRDPAAKLELASETKRILELSVDEARRMGHHYIGTEHLLLALVRHPVNAAIDVLKELGVTPEQVRRTTRRVLQESPIRSSRPPEGEGEQASGEPTPRSSAKSVIEYPPPTAIRSLSHVNETKAFEIVQATISRILDMVEAEKLTTVQATELLAALQPHLKLTPGQEARIGSIVNKPESAWKQHVTVTIKDKDSEVIDAQTQMRLEGALKAVDAFLLNVLNNRYTVLVFDMTDGKKQISVQIDEDKEYRNPPTDQE